MRWLPQSLLGRLTLFLAGGLMITQLISATILLRNRDQALYQVIGAHTARRISAVVDLLDTQDAAQRRQLVTALDLPPTRISLDLPWSKPAKVGERYQTALFHALLYRRLGSKHSFWVEITDTLPPPFHPHRVNPHPPPRSIAPDQNVTSHRQLRRWRRHRRAMMLGLKNFVVQVRLKDGEIVTFQQMLPEEVVAWPVRLLLTLLILVISVVVLAALAVRALTQPLSVLADAATELGRDIRRAPLEERGSLEVRRAAQAFNTMQDRLLRYIEDRDRILAAVSHDLKTPMTRLRLRTELLEDVQLRDKFQADVDDMQQMAQAALDFLRGGENTEPVTPTDMDALLECLQEEVEDTGYELGITGKIAQPFPCRPLALKRCLVNLVDNALKYGQHAEIKAKNSPKQLILSIRDHGPGIPVNQLEQVFEPFYRLEGSRNRETGGTGLGLGIARNIARAHGGELWLRNHPQGGLEAVLDLPR